MSSYPCTLYDASAPLLSQRFHPSASSFAQTGSWSWVNLIDSGVKGAISVLSRYSAGGVDQYTIIVGQLLCVNFRLSNQAVTRLRNAIMELKSMNTLGDMLHFGFGVDSIVRNLAATVEGGILVALCAAVTEAFHPDHGANIFWELVRSFSPPEKRAPSPMQWKALLNACAGTLAETGFPKLAEHYMQLHEECNRLTIGRAHRDTPPSLRGVSSPDSLAEALLAIGKVSTGDLISVSIIGGADVGWLAAVAQWIFDLRVSIFDPDGEQLRAKSTHQHPQVRVYLAKPSDDHYAQRIAVKGRICQLRDTTELFHFNQNDFGSALVCSRVPWNNALNLTFGSDFRCLMDLSRSFGRALAAAGRIFEGVTKSESPIMIDEQRYCKTYFNDSVGRGFGAFAMSLFPELIPLEKPYQEAKFRSLGDALEQYEVSSTNIKTVCKCEICRGGAEDGMFEERFCLLLLLETIVFIVHLMSGVTTPNDLMPMRSGIEAQYRRLLKLHASEKLDSRVSQYGAAGFMLEFNAAECEDWNIEESVAVPRLIHAARLFAGREIQSSDHAQAAISVSGIVVFLNSLLVVGLPTSPEIAGRCTVMAGHIEMHGRLYDRLEDLSDFDLHGMDYRRRQSSGKAFDPLLTPLSLTDEFDNITTVAQEQPSVVKVGLSIHERSEDPAIARSVIIGPASLTQSVLEAIGIVNCNGKSCKGKSVLPSLPADDKCIKLLEAKNDCNIWLFTGDDLSRLVALIRVSDVDPMLHTIMQFDECLECCVMAARQSQFENTIIIARRRRVLGKRLRNDTEDSAPAIVEEA